MAGRFLPHFAPLGPLNLKKEPTNTMKSKFSLLGLVLGLALLIASVESSQAQEPYQGIYNCTVTWKGDYKYYDGFFTDTNPPFFGYCQKLRGRYRGYIINRNTNYDIVFVNSKTREFSVVTGCVWDCAAQFSCGKRQDRTEVCFSSCKTLNINEYNLDLDRCEIKCLSGRVRDRQLGTRDAPYLFPSIPTLRGTFCRQSCYRTNGVDNTCFLPVTDGKKDFIYDHVGPSSGATSCVTARCTYRLNSRLTKEWVASGTFTAPTTGTMIVRSYLEGRNHTWLGTIDAAEWCALRNLTGVEPFMP